MAYFPSALLLTWRKPDQPNGVLLGYEVHYHEVIGTQVGPLQKRSPIENPEETRAKLASLKPATKYRVHIMAKTIAGAGDEYVFSIITYLLFIFIINVKCLLFFSAHSLK